jgi:hypothetical protein
MLFASGKVPDPVNPSRGFGMCQGLHWTFWDAETIPIAIGTA